MGSQTQECLLPDNLKELPTIRIGLKLKKTNKTGKSCRPENTTFEVRSSQEPEFINIYFITEAATRILFQTAAWAKGVQVRLINR
jgi:hypothetical protein